MSLKLDLTDPDVLVHDPIAHEAVKRSFEAGRFVFLKPKMSNPSETVTTQQAI